MAFAPPVLSWANHLLLGSILPFSFLERVRLPDSPASEFEGSSGVLETVWCGTLFTAGCGGGFALQSRCPREQHQRTSGRCGCGSAERVTRPGDDLVCACSRGGLQGVLLHPLGGIYLLTHTLLSWYGSERSTALSSWSTRRLEALLGATDGEALDRMSSSSVSAGTYYGLRA